MAQQPQSSGSTEIVRPGNAFPFPPAIAIGDIELSDDDLTKVVGGVVTAHAAPGTVMCPGSVN